MKKVSEKTIGKQLAEAREAKGWALEEAARRTKLKRDALALMESDEFDRLPSVSYARGFIRLYARELGLDGWAMLRQFNGIAHESLDMLELQPEDLESIPKRSSQPLATPQGVGLAVIVMVFLVGLGAGGMWLNKLYTSSPLLTGPKKQTMEESGVATPVAGIDATKKAAPVTTTKAEPVTPRAEPIPAQTAPVAVPVVPAAPQAVQEKQAAVLEYANKLKLQADAETREENRWVRVTAVRAGKEQTLFDDILPAGELMPKPDQTPWTADAFVVNMREASAVSIIYNGQNYGKYDSPGLQRVRIPSQ